MTPRRLLLTLLLWLLPCGAAAEVERFAVLIGNDLGQAPEPALKYAASDAAKLHAVLRDLGGFAPVNMVLLQGERDSTVRSTLIALNDRIRSSEERGNQAVLFVYYSGHADADALHLGETRLRVAELEQLVRGSSAEFRLLIVDACRSGAFTRVKGGRPAAPFALPPRSGLTGRGIAFLTASSASEDAQESDELRGSFFTHALVSGLLGAADRNQDALVSLEEAYLYAYEATVRATSRTAQGVQHPTFHYDLRGQDSLVLTQLDRANMGRAVLAFPAELGFLVMAGSAEGAVVAEVPAFAAARKLSLRPGRYFIRGRGAEFLLEGSVLLTPTSLHRIDPKALERIEYARYVRKGPNRASRAHALELGPTIHSRLQGADTPCYGGLAGYALDLAHLSIGARAGLCRSKLDNPRLAGSTVEYEASLAASYPWDLPWLTCAAGVGAGLLLSQQTFETARVAPDRLSTEPFVLVAASVTVELASRLFLRLEARAATHFSKLQERGTSDARFDVLISARGALLLGVYLDLKH